jgi:hypothetical protein
MQAQEANGGLLLFYGILADVLVAIHFAIVAFVVLGLLAILVGVAFRRSWARNFWFRLVHLIAIGFIAAEGFLGMDCPLTIWERQLRDAAHQEFSGDSFMARLIHNILFFDVDPTILNRCHIAFGALVLATFVFAPPRWPRRRKQESTKAQDRGKGQSQAREAG